MCAIGVSGEGFGGKMSAIGISGEGYGIEMCAIGVSAEDTVWKCAIGMSRIGHGREKEDQSGEGCGGNGEM